MTNEVNPFGAVTRMLEQFRVPGFDMGALVEKNQKEIEALTEANKAALDSIQELTRKNNERLTQAIQGIQATGQSAPAQPDQSDSARVLAVMKELAEITQRFQTESLAQITQRANQYAEEVQKVLQPK